METSWVEQFGTLYERYGPGRLPGARRRALGAGYAYASMALVATSAFVLLVVLLRLVLGPGEGDVIGLGVLALFAYPLVVPSAFVSAWLVWRFLPTGASIGAIGGSVAVALTYLFSTLLVTVAILWPRTDAYAGFTLREQLVGSVSTGILFGFGAFLLTFWFTLPLGAAAGYLYERVRAEAPE